MFTHEYYDWTGLINGPSRLRMISDIDKLIARLNDKREEVFKLKNIIQSQTQKNLAEYHFPTEVDN